MPSPDFFISQSRASQQSLRLLPAPAAMPKLPERFWFSRIFAHAFDVSLVMGFGFYLAKIFSVLMLALLASQIRNTGKGYGALFAEVQEYAEFSLAAVTISACALFFLVALPAMFGSTAGLALFGLRIESASASRPMHGPYSGAYQCASWSTPLLGCCSWLLYAESMGVFGKIV